ncbi:MAG: tetratricopeptide repeat protein [Candidatus Kapabacteria bacterium]|nr:tetratricopeptide repeat protein [Candidatus Kapabacteria bacterium]MDW8012767.1 tetratricopeptide repeat protein [Bacteroidota bacterium]
MRWALFFAIAALAWAQVRVDVAEQQRLAQTLEAIGDYAGAAQVYERLLRSFPDSAVYLIGWGRAYAKLQRAKEVLPQVRAFLQRQPLPVVWAFLGEVYWYLQQPDSARWAWEEALRRAPIEPSSYRAVASAQYNVRLTDEAIATLLRGRRQLRQDTLFADELSAWYVRIGDVERGVQEILSLVRQRSPLALLQSRLLQYLSLPEAAQRIRPLMERYSREYPRDTLLRRLFVWFLQEIGDGTAALEQLQQLDELSGGTGIELLQFAEGARQSEQFELALQAYQRTLQRRPSREVRLRALYGYVRTAEQLVRQGVRDIPWQQIRRDYEALVREADTLPISAEALYALGLFLRDVVRDRVAARSVLQALLQRFPQTQWAALALVAMVPIALQADDLTQASTLLQKALAYETLVPEAAEWARFWQAELQFFQGRLDSARALYATVGLQTSSPAANNALERLTLLETAPDSALLRLFAVAELAFLQERFDRAQALYLRVVEQSGEDTPLAETSLLKAAMAAFARSDLNEAQRLITRLLAEKDDVLYGDRALLLLGDILEQQQRHREAIAVYQQLLMRYPTSIYSPEARRRLQRLRQGT